MLHYTNLLLDLQYDYKEPEQLSAGSTTTANPNEDIKHNLTRLIRYLEKRMLESI